MSKASALVDVSKKRVNPFKELWTNKFLYLLALPAVVYTFIFSYLTLPYIVIAFEKFNYKTGVFSPFVGLKNFEYFFKSSWAWTVTRNTLVINILFLIVGTVCSVVLAIVLNEVKAKKFLKVSQSMMLFPYQLLFYPRLLVPDSSDSQHLEEHGLQHDRLPRSDHRH